MWTRERLRTTGNPASGQSRTWTRERRIASPMLWPLGLRGDGGGGVHFSEVSHTCSPEKACFCHKEAGEMGSWGVWISFFFQGGGGLGLRDMYVCTQWQGSLQRRESVTEHENGVCESVHLYCTQRFTFSPKCFIPVATIRNETVTLTITSTWMSTASQL